MAVVAVVALALAWRRPDSPAPRPVTRTVIALPPGERLAADLYPVSTQPSFSQGNPRLLFEGQYTVGPLSIASYDVTPDGRHFVMLQSSHTSPGATQIHVVENWQAGLKK